MLTKVYCKNINQLQNFAYFVVLRLHIFYKLKKKNKHLNQSTNNAVIL